MKKAAISCIISAILLLSSNSTVSAAKAIQLSNSSSKILMSSSSSFTELPAKSNVKLDKAWAITFSNNIDMNKIDGILVQKDLDFVPVTIAVSGKNTISVKPTTSYAPNSKYTLKVFLSNGTKYSMDFTTEDAYKTVDSANNNSYLTADTVSLGDKLNGSLDAKTDNSDWYKLVVPKDANVTISAKNTTDTNNIDLYLYNKNGTNNDPITSDYYNSWFSYTLKSVRNINNIGLSAGTYYIKLSSDRSLNYSMTIDYTYEAPNNDAEPNNNYISAQDLTLNAETNGHIGYINEDGSKDSADYYKFTLTKDGKINFNLSNNTENNIDFYLYGKDGENNSPIVSDYYSSAFSYTKKSVRNIDKLLAAGTYYIKIASDNPETYTLKSTFTEDAFSNDLEDNDSYLKALTISPADTKTGHIGYIKDNTSQDTTDWYKITIDQTKDLSIDLNGENGNNINLYLYGKNGNNDDAVISDCYEIGFSNTLKSTRHISKTLEPGVYYIQVNSDSPTGYTLTTK